VGHVTPIGVIGVVVVNGSCVGAVVGLVDIAVVCETCSKSKSTHREITTVVVVL